MTSYPNGQENASIKLESARIHELSGGGLACGTLAEIVAVWRNGRGAFTAMYDLDGNPTFYPAWDGGEPPALPENIIRELAGEPAEPEPAQPQETAEFAAPRLERSSRARRDQAWKELEEERRRYLRSPQAARRYVRMAYAGGAGSFDMEKWNRAHPQQAADTSTSLSTGLEAEKRRILAELGIEYPEDEMETITKVWRTEVDVIRQDFHYFYNRREDGVAAVFGEVISRDRAMQIVEANEDNESYVTGVVDFIQDEPREWAWTAVVDAEHQEVDGPTDVGALAGGVSRETNAAN